VGEEGERIVAQDETTNTESRQMEDAMHGRGNEDQHGVFVELMRYGNSGAMRERHQRCKVLDKKSRA